MSRSRKVRRSGAKAKRQGDAARLLQILASGCDNPADVLELYYWSREPGLVDIVRGLVAMPEDARAALELFVTLARDPKTIAASLDGRGMLTFTAPEVAKTAALALYSAGDTEDAPRVLN
jgi:hypothetical protein